MRIHAARGLFDDVPEIAGALAADPDAPAVAFPTPTNAVSCQPLDVTWFHSGDFPADAACDIGITNVGVPQIPWSVPTTSSSSSSSSYTSTSGVSKRTVSAPAPSRSSPPQRVRRGNAHRRADPALSAPAAVPSPITLTLGNAEPVFTPNHSMWVPQLQVPSGYYWITGASVDPASKTKFFHSAQFFVAAGTDTSCLQSLPAVPSSSSQSSPSSITLSTSSSSPSGTSLSDNVDNGHSRGSVIAGALGGGLAVIVLLGTFILVRYFRRRQEQRRYSNVDAVAPAPGAGWRSSQAVSHVASPTGATVHSPVGSDVPVPEPTSAYISYPTTATVASPGPAAAYLKPEDEAASKKLSSTPSSWTADASDGSYAEERVQLQEAFVVPVTPNVIADGVMSERSSMGSGVGPMAISPPAQMADVQFLAAPGAAALDLAAPSPPFAQKHQSRSSVSTTRSGKSGSNAISASQVLQMSSRGS